MKEKITRLYIIGFGLFVCLLLSMFPDSVYATKMGISVDQTSIAFDADTGEKQEFVMHVTNISDKEQKISVGTIDYIIGDGNDLILAEGFDEQNGLKDWITADSTDLTLAPGQKQEVKFVFVAPESAPIGSHRGAVVFRVEPEDNGDVRVQGQIAVHVLVNIKGDTHASGRISSFDIPLMTFKEIDYVAEFENTGNIHYVPYGEVVVKNIFTKNEIVYKYKKHFVFPEKKFTFFVTDRVPSALGLYRAQVNFVDGEGVLRSRSDYTIGTVFPLIIVVLFNLFLVLAKWLMKKKGENIKKRMDYFQKKRKAQRLQKKLDQKKQKEDQMEI